MRSLISFCLSSAEIGAVFDGVGLGEEGFFTT